MTLLVILTLLLVSSCWSARTVQIETVLVEARALESLKALGMDAFKDRRPNQLSGGQQQRVGVARAFAAEPEIILADEPTANLDSKSGGDLIELMKRLNREQGVTFVFSTHDPRLLERVTRTVQMEDGRIVGTDKLEPVPA